MSDDFETVRQYVMKQTVEGESPWAALDRIESRLHSAEEVVKAARDMGAEFEGTSAWYANPDDPRTTWSPGWYELARSLSNYYQTKQESPT